MILDTEKLSDFVVLKPGETLVLFMNNFPPQEIERIQKHLVEKYHENKFLLVNAKWLDAVKVESV